MLVPYVVMSHFRVMQLASPLQVNTTKSCDQDSAERNIINCQRLLCTFKYGPTPASFWVY